MVDLLELPGVRSLAGMAYMNEGAMCAHVLKPGDVYRGALPEALAAGYEEGSFAARMFALGFDSELKRRFPLGIGTDSETGIIGQGDNRVWVNL